MSFAQMEQEDLFNPKNARFNGSDYVPDRDNKRLSGQISDIFNLMRDGAPRTLAEIADATGHPETSVSAQLRHLRKERFGSHKVEKKHKGGGLYKYQLIENKEG